MTGHDPEFTKLVFRSRYTQDSPILPEVWLNFLQSSGQPQDLLLTPHRDVGSGVLLRNLRANLGAYAARATNYPEYALWEEDEKPHRTSAVCNEAVVAACLRFDELIQAAIPLTQWWWGGWAWAKGAEHPEYLDRDFATEVLVSQLTQAFSTANGKRSAKGLTDDFVWFAELVGHIAFRHHNPVDAPTALPPTPGQIAQHAVGVMRGMPLPHPKGKLTADQKCLWSVSVNRKMETCIFRSTQTVKADAAKLLFSINASRIAWAVIDSGIDARHPAFSMRSPGEREPLAEKHALEQSPALPKETAQEHRRRVADTQGPAIYEPQFSRVAETYDFTRIRSLLDPELDSMRSLNENFTPDQLRELRRLKIALRTGRAIDWGEWMPLLRVPHDETYTLPAHPHGTHVAGIIAADWRNSDMTPPPDNEALLQGVCPDLQLYDLRVLDAEGFGSEYTVMAALQFVRHLNSHKDQPVIHGVNLSLSTPHDVTNFACGRTPVCDECERMIGNGVVVVVAAGNSGYRKGVAGVISSGYQESTITDPGNAEQVITVGSTHRFMPHAYGVSYFSSRGPTGDGRYKPDLLAPGEKIKAPVPNAGADTMDGTSMAAPHVSGAAALLMARHNEFVGQPARVKEILCKTATDLGRDRYYQGYGIVDILRALQSV